MIYVILVAFIICVEASHAQRVPETKIGQGVLRGKFEESRNGRTYSAFTGIPYARPPVDDLRFKAPVPAGEWEGTLDASHSHVACPQSNPIVGDFSILGGEDCLYLNVYTPQLPAANKSLLPVIFYIHGGAFILGSASPDWYGADIFLDKDVVFVAANYRLGPLGFATTGDEVIPGNNGLKDQNLALQWTKNNVAAFGGDPNRITVVGHSAGAASAHLHMISPLSRDLLNGVIAQSGNGIADWAIGSHGEGVRNTQRLAEFLDCPTISNSEMVECLRKVDAAKIINQEYKFLEWALDPIIPFKPVVEPENTKGAFLVQHPKEIIKAGQAADVPFLTGITTEEGALKSSGYYANPAWIEDLDKNFSAVMPIALQYGPGKEHLSRKLRKFYFGDKTIDSTTRDELTNVFTDVIFLVGADDAVRLHSKKGNSPVYYYLLGYRGSESYSKLFGDPSYNYGVCHADELLYLFSLRREFPNFKPTEEDKKMSKLLITLWTNFVTTGNPTPEVDSVVSTKWEPVRSNNFEYYSIKSADDVEMTAGLFADRAKFIRKLDLHSKRTPGKNEL